MIESITLCHMADHYELSREHVEDALSARAHLTDLYQAPERDGRLVAALNGELGDALKLAEVHALLAIAQGLQSLRLTS